MSPGGLNTWRIELVSQRGRVPLLLRFLRPESQGCHRGRRRSCQWDRNPERSKPGTKTSNWSCCIITIYHMYHMFHASDMSPLLLLYRVHCLFKPTRKSTRWLVNAPVPASWDSRLRLTTATMGCCWSSCPVIDHYYPLSLTSPLWTVSHCQSLSASTLYWQPV